MRQGRFGRAASCDRLLTRPPPPLAVSGPSSVSRSNWLRCLEQDKQQGKKERAVQKGLTRAAEAINKTGTRCKKGCRRGGCWGSEAGWLGRHDDSAQALRQ